LYLRFWDVFQTDITNPIKNYCFYWYLLRNSLNHLLGNVMALNDAHFFNTWLHFAATMFRCYQTVCALPLFGASGEAPCKPRRRQAEGLLLTGYVKGRRAFLEERPQLLAKFWRIFVSMNRGSMLHCGLQ
jgi:hypothetical protein